MNPLDTAVGTHEAVIAGDDEQRPAADLDRLDVGDRKPEVSGKPHADGFVLDCVRIAANLGLEDMSRGGAIHWSPPPTVR